MLGKLGKSNISRVNCIVMINLGLSLTKKQEECWADSACCHDNEHVAWAVLMPFVANLRFPQSS